MFAVLKDHAAEMMQLSALVRRLYDSPENESSWNDVLTDMARLIGGHGVIALLGTADATTLERIAGDLMPDEVIGTLRPLLPAAGPEQGVYTRGDWLVVRTVAPEGLSSWVVFAMPANASPQAMQGAIAVLEFLLPHMLRSTNLGGRRFWQLVERELMEDSQQRFGLGILVLNRQGDLLVANSAGESLLARQRLLQLHGRRLRVKRQGAPRLVLEDGDEFARMVGEPFSVQDTQGGAVGIQVRTIGQTGMGCQLLAAALPAYVVYLRPLSCGKPAMGWEQLKTVFGLSSAEARVASLIVEGLSAKGAAAMLSVSPNTVRTQTRSVYMKTGVSNRAQLVTLMMSGTGLVS